MRKILSANSTNLIGPPLFSHSFSNKDPCSFSCIYDVVWCGVWSTLQAGMQPLTDIEVNNEAQTVSHNIVEHFVGLVVPLS